jgi:hypothetical protein
MGAYLSSDTSATYTQHIHADVVGHRQVNGTPPRIVFKSLSLKRVMVFLFNFSFLLRFFDFMVPPFFWV